MGRGFGLGLGTGSDGLGTGSVGPGLGVSTDQATEVSIINETPTNRPIHVERDFINPPTRAPSAPILIRRPLMFDSSAGSSSHSADIPQRRARTRHDEAHASRRAPRIDRRHRRTNCRAYWSTRTNDSSIARLRRKHLHSPGKAGYNPPSSDPLRCDPF